MKHQLQTIRAVLEDASVLNPYGSAYNESVRDRSKQALNALSELERMAGGQKPILIVQHGEICYKSQDDDQTYGMWCPVTPDTEHGLRNGTQLYAAPPAQQPHERHLLNLLARIHGDGGHYTAEHGLEKSVSDADQKVADLHLKAWEAQQPQAEVAEVFYCKTCGTAMQMPHDDCLACERGESQQSQAEKRCEYCDGTGDVHSIDGQWRGECQCQKQPQAEAVPDAMKVVLEAMRSDPDYAWSWHCNVAMAFYDAGGDIYTANQGAARFMRMLADVEPAHELPAAPQQAEAVPPGFVVDRGFRWDGEKQQHIPQLTIEFEPVPANSPCDAQGWKDRDAVAQMFAAAQGEKP